MFLALKEIKKEKLRFLMIIVVTALIAFLVYFLASLAFGLASLNRTAVDYWNAEGIIISKSANQNIYASSIDVSQVDTLKLKDAMEINVANTTVYVNPDGIDNNDATDLVLMGYAGTPGENQAPIIEGRNLQEPHEILLSDNFKKKVDVALGDDIVLAKTGRVFKVVGFTGDTNFNTIPVGYVNLDMASQAMMLYSTGEPDVDAVAMPTPNMPARISAILSYTAVDETSLNDTDLEYIPIDEFIKTIPGYQAQILTFGMMIVALTLISSIIIGIFMYILTMQKKSVFGVLKIQGYKNGYIMKSVLYQSLILITLGLLMGLVLTMLTVQFLPDAVPVTLYWPLNAAATIITIVCSFLGTLISARSILKIDPLSAL